MTQKKRILVICPHPENVAPGQRLKYEQYFSHFRQNNYEIVVSPFMTMSFWNLVYKKGFVLQKIFWTIWGYLQRCYDVLRVPFYDGVYVFLWATPFGDSVFERLILLLNKKVIYDIDDMVFLGHHSKANRLIAFLKGKNKMIYLMKNAKHVIVCTPKLHEFVAKYNLHLTDISSTINTDTYVPVNEYSNNKKMTLGWSGSHSTSKYLYLLADVLKKLQKEVDFNLLVIGDSSFKIEGLNNVTALEWKEETEVEMLQKIDIGLYPLPNEEWVYGKSGLKALQYMALGIPTIATSIGANLRIIEDKRTGYLVNTEEEWLIAIEHLIKNANERRRVGLEGRKNVENHYSINANKDSYLRVFQAVYGT